MRPARLLVLSLAVSTAVACRSDMVSSPHSAASGQASMAGAVAAGADLQLSGSSNNGSPVINTTYQYAYQIKNAGPDTAFGVVFVDTLLNGSTVTAAGTTTWDCAISPTATSIRCDIGVLRKGDQVTIMMSVGAFTAGTLTNTGIVTSIVPDPQPANNAVTVTVKVQAAQVGGGKVAPPVVSGFSSLPAVFQGGAYNIAGLSVSSGFQFTAAQSGSWVGVFASLHGNGLPGQGECWIMSDDAANPDNPGSLVGMTVTAAIPATGGTLTFFPAQSSLLPVPIVAGQKYWMFCRGRGNQTWGGDWDFSANSTLRSLVATGTPAQAFTMSGVFGPMPAFQVNVSQ
jgi:hypothetical protein